MKRVRPELIFRWSTTDSNIFRLEAFRKEWERQPVGVVYVERIKTQHNKCTHRLYLIETLENFRRLGIGTAMHKELERDAASIITCARNKRSEAFLKSRGYKFSAELDQWVWLKP